MFGFFGSDSEEFVNSIRPNGVKPIKLSENYKVGKLEPKDTKNGIGVSTMYTSDFGFETAILELDVIPVERYKTEQEAKKGHSKWVKFVKSIKNETKVKELDHRDRKHTVTIKPNLKVFYKPQIPSSDFSSQDFNKKDGYVTSMRLKTDSNLYSYLREKRGLLCVMGDSNSIVMCRVRENDYFDIGKELHPCCVCGGKENLCTIDNYFMNTERNICKRCFEFNNQ